MSYETIRIDRDDRGVATLSLSRPEKHNAMNEVMIAELTAVAADLGGDDDIRVVVLTGEGPSFCAGGDLGWMQRQMAADRATRAAGARALALMLRALNDLPKPLIARVQGNAFGGGIGLMSVCDVVVASETAKFALTETRLGLIPATIGPYVVARMGATMVRRVFMSGRVFDGAEAVALGLVARLVDEAALDAAVEAEAVPYLACAPGAVAAAKALVADLGPRIDDAVIDRSIEALVDRWESAESREGISAFFDKRKPDWAK